MRGSKLFRFGAVFIVGAALSMGSYATPSGHAQAQGGRRVQPPGAPMDEYLNARLTTGNRALSPDAFTVAGQQALAVQSQTAASDPADASAVWLHQGPTNIDNPHPSHNDGGGRIADLAVDPNNANTVYVATAGGGVWKTTDHGQNFSSVWPNSYTQAIGAVAVGQDGTVWVGTGETNPGGGSITFFGDGIYKSTDAGATWTNVGLNDSWTIARIVVDPSNAQHVWVAVSGNLFLPIGKRGVYVTSDGGTSWTQSLAAPNSSTGASDLALSRQHPGTVYAAMWDHVRVPDHRTYTGIGTGVWKTTNSGATWTELTSTANAAITHLPADNPANGRIGLAVAPSDETRVYVNYANDPNGAFESWHVSTDGGATFTAPAQAQVQLRVPVTNSSYVYGWWFAKTFVDPKDQNHVIVTGLCLWSSTDGGTTFPTDDCSVHADQHAMAWDPNVANQVYLGNDGGFYTSTQNGASGTWTPAAYQPWPQFVGLDVSEQDPTRIIGGLQDNGSQRSWNDSGATVAPNQWNSVFGGDGQQNLIDPQNQQIVYSCLQYGICSVSYNGGNSSNEFDAESGNPQSATAARHVYFTPLAFDPSNPSTVYYAGDIVNVSHDDGATWAQISPNLGGPNPGTETDPLYAGHYGAVTTISVARQNPQIVWVGTDTGMVWKTTNALSSPTMPTWTQVGGLPTRWVSKVLVNENDPQVVYVAFSGYRAGDNLPYIERTNDGGATWTNLSTNLPEATVNDIVQANGRLYVATDTGVYVSEPSADPVAGAAFNWMQLGSNLPNTAATALRFIPPPPPAIGPTGSQAVVPIGGLGTMFVSTFGRGVWALPLTVPAANIPEAPNPLLLPATALVVVSSLAILRGRRRRSAAPN